MNYIVNGNEKGTIFCIHGNSSSAKVFEKILSSDKISQTKIAVDLLGHGENHPKNLSLNELSFESQKKHLLERILQIDDHILLVGNSLGGHLAIELAKEIPNLKGLVIMGSPPLKKPINFEEAFLPVAALNTFLTEFPNEKEIIEAFDIAVLNNSEKANMISDFKKANPFARKATAIDLMQNRLLDQYTIFTELLIPKYIIRGDSDISVNSKYLEKVKNACDKSCEIIDIQNCGHYPSIDKPIEFINFIKNIATEVFK